MSMIRVDYGNARQQARKLQTAADNCGEVIRKLQTAVRQLPDSWEGASAEAFLEASRQQIAEIRATQERLEAVAAHIRRVADELERKEKELAAAMEAGAGDGGAGGRSGGGF